jgi:hypothetical protein
MPLQATSGAASYDAFGGGVPVVPAYIEDVFSTWLYTGNGSTQTITNGIDLAGKGGAVFAKSRTNASGFPSWFDTNRGALKRLQSSSTLQEGTVANSLTAFNSDGFSVGSVLSASSENFVGWTFRKQSKFFDVVTYTGNGASSRNIAHNLGSVPGCFIVKETNYSGTNWRVYHRSLGNTNEVYLNTTAASTATTSWASTTPTSAVFTVGVSGGAGPNDSGSTYVAYLFAHNAGGFGLTGTDNVISCGTFTTDSAAAANINLGYEPQWLMYKLSSGGAGFGNWVIRDTMRGWVTDVGGTSTRGYLAANSSNSETDFAGNNGIGVRSTGFQSTEGSELQGNATYIYIAIRRGPMKVPKTGTSVFGLNARTGTGANATVTGSAGVSDAVLIKNRGSAVASLFASRLTNTGYLETSSIASEVAAGTTILQASPWDVMDGVKVGTTSTITNASGSTFINYLFDRAPGFFDVVCYTGTGVARTIAHNLQAVPELMIVKSRNALNAWQVYSATLGATQLVQLNSTGAASTSATMWNNTAPTSSVFTLGNNITINTTSDTYIAYLFDTCPGVSKVGSFTGTGATQVINCGFTGGARFVLIKATSTTGDWFYWDSARGIVAGDDPYLRMNQSAAEVTNTDWVDTAATGFELSNAGGNLANSSGVTYIFLAIA